MRLNLFIATIAASAIAAPALAADLPSRVAPPLYVPPPPVFSWTGFYVGANLGDSFGTDKVSPTVFDGETFPRTEVLSINGVFGGGTVGYNYQFQSFVVGLEGAWAISTRT